MLAQDFYPEGYQGGVGVIQNGMRVATNGDIRLEPTPGLIIIIALWIIVSGG